MFRHARRLPALAAASLFAFALASASAQTGDKPLNAYAEVFPALAACFRQPPNTVGMEVTLVFTFNRKGEIFGKPRISYSKLPGDAAAQRDFVAAALRAIADCTPLKFTDKLGGAVAGRPFAIRFIGMPAQQRI